jgi:hypothetical protein
MTALMALLLVAGVEFPEIGSPDDITDQAAMDSVGAHEMFFPIRRCVEESPKAYRVRPEEVGNRQAATALANRTLAACGYDSIAKRLLAALRRADPKADEQTILRRAERELLPLRVEADMFSEVAVRMPPPPPPTLVFICPGPNCLTASPHREQ